MSAPAEDESSPVDKGLQCMLRVLRANTNSRTMTARLESAVALAGAYTSRNRHDSLPTYILTILTMI